MELPDYIIYVFKIIFRIVLLVFITVLILINILNFWKDSIPTDPFTAISILYYPTTGIPTSFRWNSF